MTTYNSYVTGAPGHTVTIGSASYPNPVEVTATGYIMPSTATAGIDGLGSGYYTLFNEGSISGGKSTSASGTGGIGVDLTSAKLTNSKDINGGNGYYGSNGGVGVSMAGTLTNSANAVIGGGLAYNGGGTGGVGVVFSGGTLTNDAGAQIEGGGIGYGYRPTKATGNGGNGIDLGASAIIKNYGSIDGGGGPATGTKTHPYYGGAAISAASSTDTITNYGTGRITGGNGYTTAGAGIVASGGAAVINDASGKIYGGTGEGSGTSGAGVQLSGDAQLTNHGKIEGGTAPSFGVGGAGVTISSGASVDDESSIYGGTGAGGNGVGVDLNGGKLTVAGTISGGSGYSPGIGDAVQFGSAAGKIIVDSGAKFFGDIGGFIVGDTIDMTGIAPTAVANDFGVANPVSLGGGKYEFMGSAGGDTLTTTLAQNEGKLAFTGDFSGDEFILTPDGSTGTDITLSPVCYLRGTRILTPTGEVLVETLRRGDRVVTRFGGLQPIKWIGRQSYRGAAVRDNREHLPVHLRAGSLDEGLPARDLYVSPGHSMLVDGTLVLARSLVNGITITQDQCPDRIDYFQIELEGHDCVIAEGTWSETYADWEQGRKLFHNAAEFHALYPDHPAPPEEPILCAPRPERGAALDAVLRAVVARAARGATPGTLHGFIDQVRGEWKLDGWAHDEAHPELPVLLEILLEGKVIGSVLACDFRPDLLEAGYGQGRCSFTFISPVKLRAARLSTLQVRRAVDGAPVEVSRAILGAAAEPVDSKPRLAIVA